MGVLVTEGPDENEKCWSELQRAGPVERRVRRCELEGSL